MPGALLFQTSDATIPLTPPEPATGGLLAATLTIKVVVYNVATGATLLASTTVPASAGNTGIYVYQWTHGLTVKTYCLAVYTITGLLSATYSDYFTIDNSTGVELTESGKAV